MGNVHEVIQTEPWTSPHGAAIPLRGEVAGTFPSYVGVAQTGRALGDIYLGEVRSVVAIQTGGKWGYGDDLIDWLRANVAALGDACFYVHDEYELYVREIRIAAGDVTDELVIRQGGHVGLFLVEHRPQHRAFGLELMRSGGAAWRPEPVAPDSMRARWVRALREHAPERWETWVQVAAVAEPRAAVEALEHARELAPAEERDVIDARIVLACDAIDPAMALALGRAARAKWIDKHLTEPLLRLAELEREHGDPEAAASTYVAYLRAWRPELAGNLAMLAKARPDPDLERVIALLRL